MRNTINKIHKFTAHPVGMGFLVLSLLEIAHLFFNPNPIASLTVACLSNAIMGWRIMSQTDIIRMTPTELKRSNKKIKVFLAISVIGIVTCFIVDWEFILFHASTALGACIVYQMRNNSYKKRYGDRLI